MAKFLKLSGFDGEGIGLVNTDEIRNVEECTYTVEVEKTEKVKGFFGKETEETVYEEEEKTGSVLYFKDGEEKEVSESPEQIYAMIQGA